ncbi:dihydrofolate reductase family protein [Leifsonia sp. 22587]|uniref:dihydrofolate reductase family protein n=1 Tax=Leifsonia sp. 22587 TaxID=3453946 RepID=UPI003F82728D
MGRVICDMSVSLDGYVTGPNDSRENPFGDGAEDLHAWLRPEAGDDDRAVLQSAIEKAGAVVMGRRSFEKNEGDGGWGDGGPLGDIPCFVVTHEPPTRSYPPVFTFVADGVPAAIDLAQQEGGDKDVHLFGATVMQQALPLGLVDELHLHVMPLLIGGGTRLFGDLPSAIALERTGATITPLATHLNYRVLNAAR